MYLSKWPPHSFVTNTSFIVSKWPSHSFVTNTSLIVSKWPPHSVTNTSLIVSGCPPHSFVAPGSRLSTPYPASLSAATLDDLLSFVAARLPEGSTLATESDGVPAASASLSLKVRRVPRHCDVTCHVVPRYSHQHSSASLPLIHTQEEAAQAAMAAKEADPWAGLTAASFQELVVHR